MDNNEKALNCNFENDNSKNNKRRNFLKGLFGAYAGVTTLFSYKYFDEKIKVQKNLKNVIKNSNMKIKHLEFPISYNCNLNCASCDHCAPLAPKYQMPPEVFEKDIKRLSELAQGKLDTIMLLGGEPLLNSKITDIMRIARDNFPKATIKITTNGFLLDKKEEDFWKACAKHSIKIVMSNYVYYEKNLDFNEINKIAKKYKVTTEVNQTRFDFQLLNFSRRKLNNATEKYKTCKEKINGALVDSGKLYSCSVMQGIEKNFNTYFKDKALPIAKDDILDLHKVKSIEEIVEYLNRPKTLCAYCHYRDEAFSPQKRDWKLSERKLSEWYIE